MGGGGWGAAPSRTIPDSRLKWAKSVPFFRPKRRKNPTLWGGTYLYGLCKGVPPPPRDPYLPNAVALCRKTRNCSRPVCLSSPINGYRENTAGVTVRWTAFPFSNALRYLSCRNRDKLCPDKPRWFVVRLSQLDWVNRFSHTLIQLSINRECC